MLNDELKSRCSNAVNAGRQYLLACLENNTFYDTWYGTYVTPPVEHSSSPMLCFFTALALQKTGGVPEMAKDKMRTILSSAKKGSSYGYDEKAPVDADDTAFALRTLLLLGDIVTPEIVAAALEPFRCGDSWFTFPAKAPAGITPPFYSAYQGEASVLGPHPEVHLNILSLLQEVSREAVTRIPPLPLKEGLPVCYFYNSGLYGAWLFCLLCKEMGLEISTLQSAISGLRNEDGYWPGREDGFSAVQETALALLALETYTIADKFKNASLAYTTGQQQGNGSFPGGTLWNHRLPMTQCEAYWYAIDEMSIVSTACAILSLAQIVNNKEKLGC